LDVTEDVALHKLICDGLVGRNLHANLDVHARTSGLIAGFLSEEYFMKSSVLPVWSLPYYFSPAKECLGTKQRDDTQSDSGDCGILTSLFLL
jgi:hypothetical protein